MNSGASHHPGLARPRQPRKHGALHPGRLVRTTSVASEAATLTPVAKLTPVLLVAGPHSFAPIAPCSARNCSSGRQRQLSRAAVGGLFKIERRVMSEAMDIMLKIGITERRIRNPHCTQAAQLCRLWPCPRTAQRMEPYRPSVSLQWQAVGSAHHPQGPATLFLQVQSASHLPFEAPRCTQ